MAGIGEVDGHPTIAMSYDYTVLAGTQGMRNHLKKDRLFEIAEARRLPVVLFAEGGGGRPGDVDWPHVAGLDCRAFNLFARLSGLVPLIGIASGYCFAGNAALLGCSDVVIATEDSSIGMGGPAMIEGGGLGTFEPEQVGPIDVQYANGVVDIRAKADEAYRLILGQDTVEENIPMRLFTRDNVKDLQLTNAAQSDGSWYGPTTYPADFKKLWGVG